MNKKIDIITEKLNELGFNKKIYTKPSPEEIKNNENYSLEDDFFSFLGDNSDSSMNLLNEFVDQLMNNYIPDISFSNSTHNLEFFLDKNLLKINLLKKQSDLNSMTPDISIFYVNKENNGDFSVIATIPYNEMNIDAFYRLFVEKNYDLYMILTTGSN